MIAVLHKAFLYELRSIKSSWYKLALITVLPLFSFFLIIAIFRSGVAHDLPIVVVDNDKSELSRRVLSSIESSSTMQISAMVTNTKEAMGFVKSAQAYAVIVIPNHFAQDILLQKHPHITAMINTQYILVGKILTSALSSTVMQNAAQVEYVKNLVEIQNPKATVDAISPIGIQITPFFNTYKNYFIF